MTSQNRRVAVAIAFLLGLLGVLLPGRLMAADSPTRITVQITDTGFNGKPDNLVIEVEQGALVELTFVWAHQAYIQDEHIMVLEGYKLETEKLTSQHREATLKFIADKPGTFGFQCDVECDAHDYLQRGTLRVKAGSGASGGASAASRTPTRLSVTPSSSVVVGDEMVVLMAVLRDDQGAPVPKAEVHFFVDTEFAGVKGQMEVGKARTDANGVAFADYQPTLRAEKQVITTSFEGQGLYDESQQVVELHQAGEPLSGISTEPVGLEGLRRWAPTGLAVVVLAVWATLAFVLFQAFSIAWVKTRR
ncbi:MAG: hypothetical protein KIT87_14460 [Anaerolineae bacterium]|nr:hypothetical protein [Anaerolineae bacterium]